jgi:hypothetical protein
MAPVRRCYLLRPVSFHFPSELDAVKFGPHTKFDFRDLIKAMRELDSLAEEAVSYLHSQVSNA